MKELSALAFKYPTQSVNSLLSCVVVGALGDDVGSVFSCEKEFFHRFAVNAMKSAMIV